MTREEFWAMSRRRRDGATVDGLLAQTTTELAAQVARHEVMLEGLQAQQARLSRRAEEIQLATETPSQVEALIDAEARAIVAADPTRTREQAFDLAVQQHPDLYARHGDASARARDGIAFQEPATPPTMDAPAIGSLEGAAAPWRTREDVGSPVARTPLALKQAIADERQANPALTREQAYAAALDKNPKLYDSLADREPLRSWWLDPDDAPTRPWP